MISLTLWFFEDRIFTLDEESRGTIRDMFLEFCSKNYLLVKKALHSGRGRFPDWPATHHLFLQFCSFLLGSTPTTFPAIPRNQLAEYGVWEMEVNFQVTLSKIRSKPACHCYWVSLDQHGSQKAAFSLLHVIQTGQTTERWFYCFRCFIIFFP